MQQNLRSCSTTSKVLYDGGIKNSKCKILEDKNIVMGVSTKIYHLFWISFQRGGNDCVVKIIHVLDLFLTFLKSKLIIKYNYY